MTHAVTSQVVILDYGSQYTQLITRRVREVEVYSVLLPGDASFKRVFEENDPTAIILSGGPNSVHVKGAPSVPDGFWEECEKRQIPVLGICYGMQLIVHCLGGKVEGLGKGEFGRMPVVDIPTHTILFGEAIEPQNVWMSLGDEATVLPEWFKCIGRCEKGCVVAIEHETKNLYGLQYHPEITYEKMISLIQFRKDRLIENRKVFKDEEEVNKHISTIKKEIAVASKDKRMVELKNWLGQLN